MRGSGENTIMIKCEREGTMSKEFDEFIADKPELNIATKEEVSLLKIKLGKSHRKESDWEVIKDIFQKREFITFIPTQKMRGMKTIENLPCQYGCLVVFSNIDDCTQYIHNRQYGMGNQRYVQIISISSMDVWEIAGRNNVDILIDLNERTNSKCYMYTHKEGMLKAVILADGPGNRFA